MVEHAMATTEGSLALLKNFGDVKQYINGKATDQEAFTFLQICLSQDLNPFIGEVHLIKYDEKKPAQFVVGVSAYLKWAAENPLYLGYEAGVIVSDKQGDVVQRDGEFMHPGDKLLGAWSTTDMRNRTKPLPVTINLPEYDKHQANWKTAPAMMIVKCAIVQGLRRSIPSVDRSHKELISQGIEIDVSVDEMAPPARETPPAAVEPPQESGGTPPESQGAPLADAGVVEGEHPWLVRCPEHDVQWFQSDKMRAPAHRTEGDGWCNQASVVNARARAATLEAQGVLEWENKQAGEWLKEVYGATWSKLKDPDKISAMEAMGALAKVKLAEPETEPDDGLTADQQEAMDAAGADLFGDPKQTGG